MGLGPRGGRRGTVRRSLTALIAAAAATPLLAVATPASAATKWRDVSAGDSHTCGVTTARDLWCWGDNTYGQLGVGDTEARSAPARVGAKGRWASVSAGWRHTCALDTGGRRYCWGDNGMGQLGYGDHTARDEPADYDTGWVTVSVGHSHTCGITTNEKAYCWGSNKTAQLGFDRDWEAESSSDPTVNTATSPRQVWFHDPAATTSRGKWAAVSAGSTGTCGLVTEGLRLCWGEETQGGLGLGTGLQSPTPLYYPYPVTVRNDGIWRSVEEGSMAGCGISSGRRLYCWGSNFFGQLGVGDTQSHILPERVEGKNWARVTMGDGHTCGVKTDGVGYCWGWNGHGQLGVGTILVSTAKSPRAIDDILGNIDPDRAGDDLMTWSALSAGGRHTCGIRTDGVLFCWGHNDYGQLGDGTTVTRRSPREVA